MAYASSGGRVGHAVVLGGSVAGLLAARVLSEHCAKVTIVERDRLAGGPEPRKGVPQGRHIHGLLIRGEELLSQMFPDLVPELIALGAARVFSSEVAMHHFGTWKLRADFGPRYSALCFSRPLLEWQIARRVAARPNVVVADEADVLGIAVDGGRVSGVDVRRRGEAGGEARLAADLVVDATGRGSRAPQWLESLGYGRPEETEIKVDVAYATRLYRQARRGRSWRVLNILPTPPGKRMGAVFPIEGDRWMVTLASWFSDGPPGDEGSFLEFARSLPVPDLHDAIKDAEALTPIAVHKLPSNRRRHYERLASLPEGLLVMGDAMCSFNPVYGQGMTVCALEAAALDGCLKRRRRFSTQGVQRELAKAVEVPWMIATGEDLRFPENAALRPPWISLLHWYAGKLHEASARDAGVLRVLGEVNHMLSSPAAIFRPDIALRALGWRARSA